MAERVGIPAARDRRGRLFGRAAIDAVPPAYEAHKPLTCGGCTTAVNAVASYWRRTPGGGATQVMAFYRLTGNGEHDPGCPYDFKNRAKTLIQDSRGTIVRDGENYELRLPDPDKIEQSDRLPPSKPSKPRARLQTSPSSHTLVTALSSASHIVRLLREFDNDPEALGRFRARCAGNKFRWEHFCQSASEASAIANQLAKPALLRHPLALHGSVKTVGTTQTGKNHHLRDEYEGFLDDPDGRRRLRVIIRSKNDNAFTHVQPGNQWLGYGHWRLWLAPQAPYAEIQLWITGPWSLTTWQEPVTEQRRPSREP